MFGALKPFGSFDFSASPSSLAVEGMRPRQRYPQVPWLAQTSAPNLTFFCEPLLWIVSHWEMTIKHLMYTQLCAFMYTKRHCVVFFWFWISSRKIFDEIQSVVSIKDQRE